MAKVRMTKETDRNGADLLFTKDWEDPPLKFHMGGSKTIDLTPIILQESLHAQKTDGYCSHLQDIFNTLGT